jgi:hypothetical protein
MHIQIPEYSRKQSGYVNTRGFQFFGGRKQGVAPSLFPVCIIHAIPMYAVVWHHRQADGYMVALMVYVCMYVCMYVLLHCSQADGYMVTLMVYIYIYIYIYICICIDVCIYICMYIYIYIYIYIHTCMYVWHRRHV